MRIPLMLIMVFCAGLAWSDEGTDLTDPDSIAALLAIQERVDSISAAVSECVASGTAHAECLCDSEARVLEFNKAVDELFEKFPDLETLDLVRFRTPDGMSVAQSLSAIKAQAEADLSCD